MPVHSLKRKVSGGSSDRPAAKKAKGSGGRAVDAKIAGKVLDEYTVKLNQTHIDANNNKFYVIQALAGNDGKFYAWNRWGRVGEDGQNKLVPCATKEQAIKLFESKFREKTSNAWANRDSFTPKNGKYTIVETDDSGGGADKAPMGKLTEAQISKGQQALNKLKREVASGNKAKIDEAASEFYSLIPHDFGRSKPVPINSKAAVAAKEDLLKFYLRMGFDKIETKAGIGPISGVMKLPVPKTLSDACKGICNTGAVKQCESNGSDLAKKQAGSPTQKMEPSHYGAIALYTSNAIYTEINKILRDENRGKLVKYFKYLRLFFDAADRLPKQRKTLWRGISVNLEKNAQYEKGKTVTWWSISSCTSDKKVADGFAGGCGAGCTVFTINSKTGFDVDSLSCFKGEKESILCPGTKLKVTSKVTKGGITQITMDEVGRAIE